MPSLTFNHGKFVLSGKDANPKHWTLEKPNVWVTTEFKAANEYRRVADQKAEKLLNRAFVKYYANPPRLLPPWLDPHQVDGINWVLSRSRSYLAHAPGAGKTCEAITASILGEGRGQAIFIVPPQLTVNWEREIWKFYARLIRTTAGWPAIAVIPDSSRQDFTGWNAEFLIVPDSMLTKPWVLERLILAKKKFVAVDEASRFKEPTAQRTIALFGGTLKDGRKSPGLVYDARYATLMDGSPMPNRPMELWAPTYAMAPEAIDFMSQQDFGFRFCGARMNKFGQWEFKHSHNEEELKARLQKNFMHVVTESELKHPERLRSLLFMNEDVRTREQKSWEQKHLSQIKLEDLGEESSQGQLATWRYELGLRKADWVADYVRERIESKNESILLFAWHREVCLTLERALAKYKPIVIMGGTPAVYREHWFERFQAGERKLIIGNIIAMGRGHNLQRANRVVFGEYSWTDEMNIQCEKRASRKGSKNVSVKCDYVVVPDSLDEIILQAVFKKEKRVKGIIG